MRAKFKIRNFNLPFLHQLYAERMDGSISGTATAEIRDDSYRDVAAEST